LATVHLIPCWLFENELSPIPAYIRKAIADCRVLFVENERSARRFIKAIDKSFDIGSFEWHAIHKVEAEQISIFKEKLKQGLTIGILSEAGCPGIADPGQILVDIAQKNNAKLVPFSGPNSIILALMASGMNGQRFEFVGYLPIDEQERSKRIRELEQESANQQSSKIFIETPYRNNQLIQTIMKNCSGETRLCIAADLTSTNEFVQTKKVSDWKKQIPELHKRPAIFILQA
jgi:16S rRNA (cytidine1402-2'-O)-methyltransferase